MTAKGHKRRSIALDIETELSRRGVSGQISVIVEGMPVGTKLSAGTNNWDNTWSLSAEDLGGLKFYPPEDSDGEHVLAVRVLRFDDDGFEVANTVALFDMAVQAPMTGPNAADAQRVEQEQLAAAKAEWAAAAAQRLAEAKAKWDEEAEQSLATARSAWENETTHQLTAAQKKWESEAEQRLSRATEEWEAAENERTAIAKASWREDAARQLSALKATWEAEAEANSSDLKADWQATVQKRLAAEKAAWQEQEERQLAAEKAAWDKQAAERLSAAKRAWEPLVEQRIATAEAGWNAELEQKLTEAKARWRAEEEKRMGAARTAWEGERSRDGATVVPQPAANLEDALAAARSVWEAEAEQRLSEAEAQWRVDVERRVSEIRAAFDNEARGSLKKAEERWKAEEQARLAAAQEAWQAEAKNAKQATAEEHAPPTPEPRRESHTANDTGANEVKTDAAWLTGAAETPADEPNPEWQREVSARRATADAKDEIEAAKIETKARRKQAKIEVWRQTEERHRQTTAQMKKQIAGPRRGRWRAAAIVFCVGLAAAGGVQLLRSGADPKAVLDRVTSAQKSTGQTLLYVRVDSAVVRAEASPQSAAMNSLSRNTAVQELRRRGDWVQIASPGSDKPLGWMHSTLLRTEIAATR